MKNISRRGVLLGGAATAAGLILPTSRAAADIDPIPPIQFPAPRPVVGFPGIAQSNIFVRWSDYGIRVKAWSEANNNQGGPWVNLGKPNGLNPVRRGDDHRQPERGQLLPGRRGPQRLQPPVGPGARHGQRAVGP